MTRVTIMPEFCNSDLYHGWHLYHRGEKPRWIVFTEGDEMYWLHVDFDLAMVRECCLLFGYLELDMPKMTAFIAVKRMVEGKDFVKWFAGEFPCGLAVNYDKILCEYRPCEVSKYG